jgi:hypothetical protein
MIIKSTFLFRFSPSCYAKPLITIFNFLLELLLPGSAASEIFCTFPSIWAIS